MKTNVPCKTCGCARFVYRADIASNKCKVCAMETRRRKANIDNLPMRRTNGYTEYERVCACGDSKWVSYKPKKNTKCVTCSGLALAKVMQDNNRVEHRKTYTRTCVLHGCGDTREMVSVPKEPQLCKDCSRKISRGNVAVTLADKLIIRVKGVYMYKVGEKYTETKKVVPKPHQVKGGANSNKYIPKVVKTKKVKPVKATRSSLEIARLKEESRKHREYSEANPKKKTRQLLTDEDMVSTWMKNNTPTVIGAVDIPHQVGTMRLSESCVAS